jgi:hypothetical protein
MELSMHTHSRYVVWFKYFLFICSIVLLVELIYIDFVKHPHSRVAISKVSDLFFIMLLWSTVMLINAYFYGQNITVTHDGLLVEFLGKDLSVPWDKIIEIKSASGFRRSTKNRKHILVVLTDALTPFHRLLGFLYGSSLKPAFIIYPSIGEYELLVETIKKHVGKA